MLPDQREARDVVIEGYDATPVVHGVTALATRAELAVVTIILAVA